MPDAPGVPDVQDLARPVLDLYGPHDDHDDDPAPPDTGPDTRYARAPLFPVDPDRYEAVRAATALDSDRYLKSGLSPVDCRQCGATVQVKKLAPGYTAVQWNSAALDRCAYFAEQRTAGADSRRTRSCPHLSQSIRDAAAEGRLGDTDSGD
ncbi:MAG TPA: hypothetical protein VFR17_11490 [Mycobacterium sp.]|nr:hypothetical protein [Mycobacterium sp.]